MSRTHAYRINHAEPSSWAVGNPRKAPLKNTTGESTTSKDAPPSHSPPPRDQTYRQQRPRGRSRLRHSPTSSSSSGAGERLNRSPKASQAHDELEHAPRAIQHAPTSNSNAQAMPHPPTTLPPPLLTCHSPLPTFAIRRKGEARLHRRYTKTLPLSRRSYTSLRRNVPLCVADERGYPPREAFFAGSRPH